MPHRRVLTHEVRKVKTGGSKQIRFLYQTFCLMTFPCRIPWEKFYSYLSQPDSIRFLWVLFDESPNPLGEGVMKWGVERIHTQSPHTPPQCPAMPRNAPQCPTLICLTLQGPPPSTITAILRFPGRAWTAFCRPVSPRALDSRPVGPYRGPRPFENTSSG